MTLILDLAPELEAALLGQAAPAGTPPGQWAAEALAGLLTTEDAADEAWATAAYDESEAESAAGAVPIPLAEALALNDRVRAGQRRPTASPYCPLPNDNGSGCPAPRTNASRMLCNLWRAIHVPPAPGNSLIARGIESAAEITGYSTPLMTRLVP